MFELFDALKHAARRIRHAAGWSSIAVVSLALGIGGATAVFSLVDAMILKPLPYRQADRLVFVREVVPSLQHLYPTLPANIQHFKSWRQEARSFDGMAAFLGGPLTLAARGGQAEILDGARVSAGLFELLGTPMAHGRSFRGDEEAPGRDRVAVITDGLWHRRFGAAPAAIGSVISLDGLPHTIVGVLPPSFRFPRRDDLGPLAQLGERVEIFRPLGAVNEGWGGDYDYSVMARLRPGVTLAEAGTELDLLENRIDRGHQLDAKLHGVVAPLRDVIAAPVRAGLYALLAGVGLLLLIVCVNLANLLLARASGRSGEIALRLALGASRASLVRDLASETVLLAATGGLLGTAAASLALRLFVHAAPVELPRLDEVGIDPRGLAFALLATIACVVVTGLVPALRLDRLSSNGALLRAASPKLTAGGHTMRLREALVGCEVGLSTALLVLAGLLTASIAHLVRLDKGFQADRAVAVRLRASYPQRERRTAFFHRALEALRALPPAAGAAFVSNLPLTGESNVNSVELEGADKPAVDRGSQQSIEINVRFVSDDYFRVMGIPLLRGRPIEAADGAPGAAGAPGSDASSGAGGAAAAAAADRHVAVVSERLAAKLWPGRDPLGRKFSTGSGVGKVEVVGVVKDVHNARLEQGPTLIAYVPFFHRRLAAGDLVLRSAAPPEVLQRLVRQRIAAIDPEIAVPPLRTMAEVVADSMSQRRFEVQLAAGFALIALLLAVLGIYGVVAYGVAQRRAEIGIRMALGASVGGVLRLVVGRSLRPVLLGLAAGLAAAAAAAPALRALLAGVSATDPLVLGAVATVLLAAALPASLLPAWRAAHAARSDPGAVLRTL